MASLSFRPPPGKLAYTLPRDIHGAHVDRWRHRLAEIDHLGEEVLPVGLGMVIYSEIVSPGYYAQHEQWAFVGMFAILLFGAVLSVMQLLRERKDEQQNRKQNLQNVVRAN